MKKAKESLQNALQYLASVGDAIYSDRNRLKYITNVRGYDSALSKLSETIEILRMQYDLIEKEDKIKQAAEKKRLEETKK